MSKDKEIWENYARRVTLVARRKPKPIKAKPEADKTATRKLAEKAPIQLYKKAAPSQLSAAVSHALERKREKNLREGEIEIDARLDLHGMTQKEAYEALENFMHRKAKAGARHLLIITGKGRGGEGVLRRNLQPWLGQLPEAKAILAIRPAAIRHGGEGAFYVLLRKK